MHEQDTPLDDRWHGWRVAGQPRRSIHVGPLPRRKSIALYVEGGGRIDVLAYFRAEADAEQALEFLDSLAGATP